MYEKEDFRGFLDRLRKEKELVDIRQAVDIRHIATLVDQSDTALYFHDVIGYDVPVVSGIIRSSRRASLSMGCSGFQEIAANQAATDAPAVADAPIATVASASMPLPNSVIARTIHRIGYACGDVASTTAVEGAVGVFNMTCTSGQTYQASPVRGRYHFRKVGNH